MKLADDVRQADWPSISRRRLIVDLAGASIVIAIPVGAVIATAHPIANPPSQQPPRNPNPQPSRNLDSQPSRKRKTKRRGKSHVRTRDDEKRIREQRRSNSASRREAKTP